MIANCNDIDKTTSLSALPDSDIPDSAAMLTRRCIMSHLDGRFFGTALRAYTLLRAGLALPASHDERQTMLGITRGLYVRHRRAYEQALEIAHELAQHLPPVQTDSPVQMDSPAGKPDETQQSHASKGFPANPAVPPLYTRTRKAIKHLYKKSSGEKNDVPRTSVDNSTPVDKKLPANPEWTIARDRARELGVWLRWYRNAADTKAEMWGGRMSKWFASMLAYARSAGIGARDAARLIGEQFAALRLRCTREAMEDTKRIELEAHVIAAFATCANAAVVARSASPVNGHTTASRQQASTAYVGRTAAHDPRLTAAALAMIPAKEQTNLGLAAFRSLRATLGYNRNGLPA